MGASISFDSKYKLILDAEVECISNAKPSASKNSKSKSKTAAPASESESASESGSESGSRSGSGSGSDSDSEDETKIFTVKLTPEIIGYIRTYIRDNDFLDIMDTITEIELNEYGHGPDSALVFDAQSVIYNINDNKIEASGEWEYIAATPPPTVSTKSSRKHKSKGGSNSRSHDDDDDDNNDDDSRSKKNNNNGFKTKDDELALSEIENIISERFKEYSKHRDFVIHESKTSSLILNIHSVEVVKD